MKQQELQINQTKSDIRRVLLGMLARAKDGVVQMAPGVAKRILDEMNFEGQRSVKEHRVLKHLWRITDGLWRESFAVTIAVLPSGEMMVIDGQHRLTAISRNPASIPITIILAKAATEQEARRLYAGFMAVALYTFRYQPGKAHSFWHGLAENDGLKKDDPRATLLRDIFERASNVGAARQITQAPSLAWNAYCQGRSLKIIKCITGAAITLWGTPISGRSK